MVRHSAWLVDSVPTAALLRLCELLAVHLMVCLKTVVLNAGKFYTLTTGSNENRWEKMKPRLVEVVKSFQVTERFTG